jgi:hypothetical protein
METLIEVVAVPAATSPSGCALWERLRRIQHGIMTGYALLSFVDVAVFSSAWSPSAELVERLRGASDDESPRFRGSDERSGQLRA